MRPKIASCTKRARLPVSTGSKPPSATNSLSREGLRATSAILVRFRSGVHRLAVGLVEQPRPGLAIRVVVAVQQGLPLLLQVHPLGPLYDRTEQVSPPNTMLTSCQALPSGKPRWNGLNS
jgi:hypothetical protein